MQNKRAQKPAPPKWPFFFPASDDGPDVDVVFSGAMNRSDDYLSPRAQSARCSSPLPLSIGKSALAEIDKFLVANGGHGGSCFTKLISSLVTNTYIIYIGKRKNWKAQFLRCYFYKWVHVNKLFCTCPWSYLTSILLSRLRSYLHRCIQTLSKQSWRVQQTYQRLWIPYLKNGRSSFGDSDR